MSLERLERIEAEFRHDEKAFLRRGALLKEVRDERLYKGMFERFEDYCQDRLQITRVRAHQLIEAFETTSCVLTNCLHQPENEGQVRPLIKLEPEQRPTAWQEAVERSDGKPTGKVVAEVVKEMLGESEPDPWDIWDATEQLRKKIQWCAERWPRGQGAAAVNQLVALSKQFESMMEAADAAVR